jgi:hypothetical protein
MPVLYDKTGREIVPGDVLKVFHFTGDRKKRHYMYKQAIEYETTTKGSILLQISHLDMNSIGYCEFVDGRSLRDYEIVQSIDAKFEDRPRRAAKEGGL